MNRVPNARVLVLVVLVALALGSPETTRGAAGAVTPCPSNASVIGCWDNQVADIGIVGIEAALLNNGKVLFYEGPRNNPNNHSQAALFDPTNLMTVDVDPSFVRNIFCSGLSILPDGRVLATGGEPTTSSIDGFAGTPDATFFDPSSNTWSDASGPGGPPAMQYARWYPSNVQMPDGTTLVLSGLDENGKMVNAAESYDPSTGTWTTLPASADEYLGLYPRTMVLTDGRVLQAGKIKNTKIFNPVTEKWKTVAPMIVDYGSGPEQGPRKQGASVLLPDLHTVLAVGGFKRTPSGTVFTKSASLLDTENLAVGWQLTGSLTEPRSNSNLVLMDDGSALAVGGGGNGLHGGATKTSERFAPSTDTWSVMDTQTSNRTYHSTALLLPDGRVISAGSDSGLPEQTKVDIYTPPYLFNGSGALAARPQISSVSDGSVNYGQSFTINTSGADSTISRVALIRPGATTHGVDFDQRYVDLSFSTGSSQVAATAPADSNIAPPGYYMLVVLNANGVPSVARFVHVG